MAIIFPDACRGLTAGALREAKRKGYTTACGGQFSTEYLRNNFGDATAYLDKREPTGVFMTQLSEVKQHVEDGADAIFKAGAQLVAVAKEANKNMADVTGKFRDGTAKLGDAIDKMNKVAERGDFANTVKLVESLVTSLERLSVLEEKGVLVKVMSAMKQS